MKSFIIKTINLVLICVAIYVYQKNAMDRQNEIDNYNEQLRQARLNQAISQSDMNGLDGCNHMYNDGTYQGTGTGFGGDVVVEIEIMNDVILSVQIIEASKETPDYIKSAEKILEDVINMQSTKVDTVSGATLSSNGILEAINNGLEAAENDK